MSVDIMNGLLKHIAVHSNVIVVRSIMSNETALSAMVEMTRAALPLCPGTVFVHPPRHDEVWTDRLASETGGKSVTAFTGGDLRPGEDLTDEQKRQIVISYSYNPSKYIEHVYIVTDVVATGGAVRAVIDALKEYPNVAVCGVIALVDIMMDKVPGLPPIHAFFRFRDGAFAGVGSLYGSTMPIVPAAADGPVFYVASTLEGRIRDMLCSGLAVRPIPAHGARVDWDFVNGRDVHVIVDFMENGTNYDFLQELARRVHVDVVVTPPPANVQKDDLDTIFGILGLCTDHYPTVRFDPSEGFQRALEQVSGKTQLWVMPRAPIHTWFGAFDRGACDAPTFVLDEQPTEKCPLLFELRPRPEGVAPYEDLIRTATHITVVDYRAHAFRTIRRVIDFLAEHGAQRNSVTVLVGYVMPTRRAHKFLSTAPPCFDRLVTTGVTQVAYDLARCFLHVWIPSARPTIAPVIAVASMNPTKIDLGALDGPGLRMRINVPSGVDAQPDLDGAVRGATNRVHAARSVLDALDIPGCVLGPESGIADHHDHSVVAMSRSAHTPLVVRTTPTPGGEVPPEYRHILVPGPTTVGEVIAADRKQTAKDAWLGRRSETYTALAQKCLKNKNA